MLKLININKAKGCLEANYVPEDSKEIGYVKIDIADDSVVESKTTSLDGFTKMYYVQARERLRKIKMDNTFPKEMLVMWY